ncbi:aspartate/glutamate racemase family protein [Zobellella sp. DQSA1]|uniref:aspartate/glutamate racemase family protein n=1 Tax=Zobellella sp. DQSA1 TaxID=3342386 RepID=UPI0035BED333
MMPELNRRRFMTGTSAALLSAMLLPKGAAAAGAEERSGNRRPLRILILNPNSSPEFTEVITSEARRSASPGTEFVGVTAEFGPRYVGTHASVAVAGHAALDGLSRVLATDTAFDAAILAGFGALGAPALRELAPFPVVDMLEASLSAALLFGRRSSILTGGVRWVPMLQERVQALGLSERVASVRAIPLTGAEIVADRERALSLLAELSEACVRDDGAECVVLGGAAVAGMPRLMADRVSVPLIDNVAVAVATAEMLARVVVMPAGARQGLPAIDSVGLSAELATAIRQG